MLDFDRIVDLRTKIIERYSLYELLELVEIDTPEFLDIWDGWIDNHAILEDLRLLEEDIHEE